MKRVFFTESQIRRILQEEYPLNTADGPQASPVDRECTVSPDPVIATDDKMQKDLPTINQKKSAKKAFWNGFGGKAMSVRFPDMTYESKEYDNAKVHGKVNQSVRQNFLSSSPKGRAGKDFQEELESPTDGPTMAALMMRKHRAEQGIGPDAGNKDYVDALDDAIDQAKGNFKGTHAGGTHTTTATAPKTGNTVKNPQTGETVQGKKCEDGNNIYYF